MRSGFAACTGRVTSTRASEVDVDRCLRRDRGCLDDRRATDCIARLATADGRGATDEEMTAKADQIIDRAASRLQQIANRAAAEGGVKAKLAQPLADDAAFLRKLKPSLIVKRVKGEAPTNQKPAEGSVAPPGPQLGKRPKPTGQGGPNPWIVIGAALAAGILLAKVIDWRGHAHPRD
jgi:hypothetical protein